MQHGAAQGLSDGEARGWKTSEEKTKWYTEQLAARGIKVLPPSQTLKADLHQIGQQLTGEWLKKAGADGQAVIDTHRSKRPRLDGPDSGCAFRKSYPNVMVMQPRQDWDRMGFSERTRSAGNVT